ncbi:MAG TPA: sugar transferase [Acidimicrobiales bacterium]|nr:sugar transferase [Acidimicrobiales bacterium]
MDAVCLLLALGLAHPIRFGLQVPGIAYFVAAVLLPVVWVGVFHGFGLYSIQHLSGHQEMRRTASATSIGVLIIALGSYWTPSSFPRAWLALVWVFALIFELFVRQAFRWELHRRRADGRLSLRTLVVGNNGEAAKVATQLKRAGLGFRPLGYIRTSANHAPCNGLPVLGHVSEIGQLIREHAPDTIFIASSAMGTEDMLRVSQEARRSHVEVRVSANLPEILAPRVSVQPVGELMALSLKPITLSGAQTVAKRLFDVALAGFGALVSLPLWGVIAAAIKLSSPGPALFKQERVTRHGRVFNVYKFRTMVTDGDRVLAEHGIDPSAPFFKLGEDDPRIFKVGRILRKLSLDELPQLINVIKGEMSLVGPRPLPRDQVEANPELLSARLEVPAGVTGWWQVNGRSDIDPEQAVHLDLYYIENWSLSLDLYIVLKTIHTLVARKGAC